MAVQAEPIELASEPDTARVVYLAPPIQIATVVERVDGGWLVEAGGARRMVELDPSVDPALLEDAAETGRRVLLESGVVVGALMTHRALEVDRDGSVEARLTRFVLDVREGAILRSAKAYVEVAPSRVELYGGRVVTRAREVAKTIARLISLN